MIRLMLQKLLHKKWMMLSLAIGNILLVAIAVSYPMFQNASLNRMLQEEFENYITANNKSPAVIEVTGKIRRNRDSKGFEWAAQRSGGFSTEDSAGKEGTQSSNVCESLGVQQISQTVYTTLMTSNANSSIERANDDGKGKYSISSLVGLEDHVSVVSGKMYETSVTDDGFIEAVVTVNGYLTMDLLMGEELEFIFLKAPDGSNVKVRIVGVVESAEAVDNYWIRTPDEFSTELLIDNAIFEEYFMREGLNTEYTRTWYNVFDHTLLKYDSARVLYNKTKDLIASIPDNATVTRPGYMSFLEDYLGAQNKVDATLMILQVPVLVLVCAFLYMISNQMFNMEQSEISLMKSRGAGKGQIFRLYLMQALFMGAVGLILGMPLGSFICRALGCASAFLEFVARRPLTVEWTWKVWAYALAAVLLSVLITVMPVRRQSKVSIVHQKVSKARMKGAWWQKMFLDVILLGISGYGFYTFNRQQDQLTVQVLEGKSMDPLLYLSSSLFILGMALLTLRLQPLLVRLIFRIRKNRWKPAAYASFLEIIRTGGKQQFIMTFLILTVSLGIFNTTVARTIGNNNERNLKYLTGTDIVLREGWPSNAMEVYFNPETPLTYFEPDFSKYGQIEGVESTAKVYKNTQVTMPRILSNQKITLMGIDTKAFGETAWLPSGLMEKHFYTYLNEMSVDANYVLASSNFRDELGLRIGDTVTYVADDKDATGIIIDFIDYFPSFSMTTTTLNPDGSVNDSSNYLIVAHLSSIQKNIGVTPYQVWIRMADGADRNKVYATLKENKVKLTYYKDLQEQLTEMRSSTLFEGTNGILTMSFLVILILCFIGYLIYWTLTIKSRELLYGVLRAMGMSKGEVIGMLINEQVFASILPLACGAGIGILASRMFVPLIQIAYSASEQVLPLVLLTETSDMVRLFGIIAVMMLVCFGILARQIFGMKIAQALKLGED